MRKQIFYFLSFCFVMQMHLHVDAQNQPASQTSGIDIFALMERTDLPLDEIEQLAEIHFIKVGTGRGTGYKQFQRWLYERKFHIDESGYFISPSTESANYKAFMRNKLSSSRSIEPWEDLGPTSWSATSGWNPGVGRITSVAIHPSNEDVIYVGSPGGGIWKSTDGGNTWSPLLDDINAAWMYVYNIQIDPGNQNTIYAAVMSGGVIKSTNAGSTWSATGSGPSNTRKVVVHPTNSSIVLATAANGIWRSTNGGTAWTQVNTGTAEDIEFKPGNADIVYVSGNTNNIRRSTNNGVSWTVIGAAGGITHSGRTLLGVTPDNPSIVYAVQANVSVFGRMYKSSDSGLNYVTTVVGDPAMGTNFFGYDPLGMDNLGQAGYDMAICVNPVNEDEVHIAGIICWKSTNGGFNFTSETDWDYPNGIGYNHADVHALEWVNSTIYSGSDGGIYKSTNNGDDWVDLSSGLGIRQVYRLSQATSNSAILLIGSQDNGSSYRQSTGDWIDWLGADGMDNMISPTNPNIAYGTSNGQTEFLHGQLYKTTDGGLTRTDFNEPSNGEWITPVDMHPTNHDHIYVGWTGVWESTDGGTNWTNISTGYIDKKINTLVVAASNVDHIYASVSDTLYRTTNGGTTWSFVTMAADVTSVFVSSADPAKIWVTLNATSNQVLFSTNGGTNFTSISGGLPALSARTVVVDENYADGVYVGLNIGVYYRNDDAPAWIPFGTELPLVAINELEIHQTAGKIRVATFGRGVWENDLSNSGGGPSVCGTPYYDSGGPTGEYSDDENIIDILCPDNPEDAIELTFTAFATESGYDFLKIFDGNSISAPPLHTDDGYSGTTLPGTFVSTHSTGCLTVQFTSDGSITESGWEASVDCVPMGGNNGPCLETAYVPNAFEGSVSVVNLQNNSLVTTIPVGSFPVGVCHTSDGSIVYITNADDNNINIISTSSNTVLNTIPVGSGNMHPTGICISPDNSKLYVSNIVSGTVSVINTVTNAVITSLTVGNQPFGLQITPDGTKVYVSNSYDDNITIINALNNTILTDINLGDRSNCLAISPDGTKVYVGMEGNGPANPAIKVISTSNNAVLNTIPIASGPQGMYLTQDGLKLYVANEEAHIVSIINTVTNVVESSLYSYGWPTAVSGNTDDSKIYVTKRLSDNVIIIDTQNDVVIDSFDVGDGPWGVSDFIVCTNDTSSSGPSVCQTINYDSGGPNGFYSNNENNIDTLCPDDPADKIQLEFLIFSVENTYDYLKIFDGPSIASPPLHTGSGFTGTVLPGTFISTHASGCLTTQFTSDVSVVDTGWVAEVSCVGGVCGSDFYDTGGPAATYGPDEDVVTTLCPDGPDESIHVEFLAFVVEANYDALYVFDGPSIASPIFHSGNEPTNSGFPEGGYYGTDLPGPFTSSDPGGCLTFQFLSDGSLEYAGWSASVTCLPRPENDLCENAILIGCNQTMAGTNVNATPDIEELCGLFPGTKGVWYKIIGNGEPITLTTCHASTDFDTQIHVYTGTCSVYECIAHNDDDPLCNESVSSTLSFPSLVGEEYYILISGYQQSEGLFTLESSCGAPPMDNNCLHFDGVNDNVYGASNALFELVDGTIELWVRPETKATSQTFLSYRNDAGSATRYLFNFLGNLNGLGFWNGSAYATFTYVFTPNQWYHLAFVDDGTNTKIYINGEYAGAFTIQFSGASGPQLHLVLGYDIPLSEYFKGAIDEVRIWSGALSESTIAANMSCGVSAGEECLVAYYRFNQGTPAGANGGVTTLLDETSNNLDGSLLNFALSGSTSNWIEATNGVAGNCTLESCPSDVILSLSILQDCLLFGEDTLEYYPTWNEEFGLLGNTSNGTITLDPAVGNWSSSNTNVVTIVDGHLEAIGPGTATISVAMAGVMTGTALVRVIAPVLNPVYNAIPASLTSPHNPCAVKDMPVIIIRYLPTTDGVNLDVAHAPDYFDLGEITLSEMELNLAALDDRVRFALEEGTRYRDYGQDIINSYLGYRVVEMITVYEPSPRGPLRTYDVNGLPIFEIDFHSVFERFDIEHYVNTLGVKEVWFWQYGMESGYPSYDPEIHFPCNFRFAWESNMASPVTSDVSNSNQDNTDLPIYDRTYIVYGQNIRRSQAEAIHNHGHQLERMIPYMNYLQVGNTQLFWRDFVGQDEEQNFTTGRCGWTHMPPNTTTHYDYQNLDIVFSDIMDWIPSGGSQTIVNADVWGTMNYDWPGVPTFPQKTESQWYIFWMQSFPGNNNVIEYGSDYMTNWWDIIADWDLAIANGLGLYSDTPASNTMQNEVVTTGSAGYGSLRSTIACAPSGSTITFSPFLASDTLDILSPIIIDKAIHVDGTSYPGLFLDASPSTFVFDILNTGILDLESMYIKCGTNVLQSGLRNYGDTELINMIFKTNLNSPIINNKNFLSLTGTNTLLRN